MKTVFQLLFGLALGVTGIVASLYLGLLVNGQPDWRTGAVVLCLLAATQWVSYLTFRHRIALQVLFGSILSVTVAAWLIYTSRSFFWEARYPDGSSPVTWRSTAMFLLLLAVAQAVSFFLFRRARMTIRKSPQDIFEKESSERQ